MTQLLYYAIVFGVVLALTIIYVYSWKKHYDINITLTFCLITTVCLAYALMYHRADTDTAIVSLKIIYLGGCFLPFFITMCVFNLCRIEIKPIIRLICFLGSTAIYSCVLSIGYSPIFYKSIESVEQSGIVTIHKEYGVMHTVYYFVLGLYLVAAMIALIYTFVKQKQVSRRILALLFLPDFFAVIGYLFNHFMSPGFEIMPLMYAFALTTYLLIVRRMSLYNVGELAVESIVQSGSTGFITLDLKGHYLGSNQTARRVFPVLEQFRIDQSIESTPEFKDNIIVWIDDFKRNENLSRTKYIKNEFKNDEQVFFIDVQHLLMGFRKIGYQIFLTDDTQNQNYIKLLDKYNSELVKKADVAIAAGQAKSRFLAQMSHEIRTPINAVLGMNEMILRESKDENILDYASDIHDAGKNLLSIINSILDFSKLEDGKMDLIPVKYELSTVINNLVNSISVKAEEKSLGFTVNVDETLPSMYFGDDVRITQIIINLLSNAVKYTEKGQVTLTLKKAGQTDDLASIYVCVSDTGIGIKDEDMGRLFESFERIEEERNRNIEGTGLGMSIVNMLLHMMNSKLDVESTYGEGTSFSFVLKQPIVDPTPIGDYKKRIKRSTDNETNLHTKGASVLVVDDNKMNLKVVKNLMKKYDISPELVQSGKEAIERMRTNDYHIVFLDHMMPEMNGIETLGELKKENLIPDHTAMIALTANAIVGVREEYLDAGFDDYLSKPIEVKQLEDILLSFLPDEIVNITSISEK